MSLELEETAHTSGKRTDRSRGIPYGMVSMLSERAMTSRTAQYPAQQSIPRGTVLWRTQHNGLLSLPRPVYPAGFVLDPPAAPHLLMDHMRDQVWLLYGVHRARSRVHAARVTHAVRRSTHGADGRNA